MADLSRERHLLISQIAYASPPEVRFEEIKAILVEYDRRVTELLAANTAEIERRRAAEALTERMWPIVSTIARMRKFLPEDVRVAAAALVRERDNG